MTEAELRDKLGACFGRYRVHEHHYLDESPCTTSARTRDGTRVTANRLLAERDFVLGVGSIVPTGSRDSRAAPRSPFRGVGPRDDGAEPVGSVDAHVRHRHGRGGEPMRSAWRKRRGWRVCAIS